MSGRMDLPAGHLPPHAPAPHVVWCHHAGGHGDSYRALAGTLPATWHHTFLAYPGRGPQAAAAACTDLTELAATLLPQLQPVLQAGPFACFGHSMGALVAYELTRQLHRWGLPMPFWLGVSGHRAPQAARPALAALHRCTDAELRQHLRRLGALPSPAAGTAYLDLVRADLRACETYAPAQCDTANPLPCALSTFTGDADPMVQASEMHGWSALAAPTARHHVLPGGHFYLGGMQRSQVGRLIAGDIARHFSGPPPFTLATPHDHASRHRRSLHPRIPERHLEDVDGH